MLASDATGLATWSPVVLTGGSANYIARWLTSTGLTTGLIYDNGTNVGIGTSSPTTRLTIDSGIANVSGLKFNNLNSSSPFYSGTNV